LIYGKFGAEFAKAHHFDTPGKLPEKAQAGKANVGLAMFKAMQGCKKKPSRG
jgi:hypothetical protein